MTYKKYALDGKNLTGNDLRRLIFSLGLKTTDFADKAYVSTETIDKLCRNADDPIPQQQIILISSFLDTLPKDIHALPIPLNGKRNTIIVSFTHEDHKALSTYYSLGMSDWAKFFGKDYSDVKAWFNGKDAVKDPAKIKTLGVLTHLTQNFAQQSLTLADPQPQAVRKILLSATPVELEEYYHAQKAS
jgi:hypothetical protein